MNMTLKKKIDRDLYHQLWAEILSFSERALSRRKPCANPGILHSGAAFQRGHGTCSSHEDPAESFLQG